MQIRAAHLLLLWLGAFLGSLVIQSVFQGWFAEVTIWGSCAGGLTNTSRRLHNHVIPLYTPDDKPSDIFSWAQDVYVGDPAEWGELLERYREAWRALDVRGAGA